MTEHLAPRSSGGTTSALELDCGSSPAMGHANAPGPTRRLWDIAAGMSRVALLWLALQAWSSLGQQPAPQASGLRRTWAEWQAACAALPSNRSLAGGYAPKSQLPLASFTELGDVIDAFFRLSRGGPMSATNAWVGEAPNAADFFDTARAYFLRPPIPFQPFAQKRVVPAGSQVILGGDLHGDIRSLIGRIAWLNTNGFMDGFKLVRTNCYMVFLGDYTDRGSYGVEVLYTVLRLKLANPERVILVRGNHEDVTLIARYGFLLEGRTKYGNGFDAKKVTRLYDFLPVVLYLGTGDDFAQCNHGGVEPGFDPRPLLAGGGDERFMLLGTLRQRTFLQRHPQWTAQAHGASRGAMASSLQDFQPESPTQPIVIGFMWNDFTVAPGEAQFAVDPGRAFVYGDQVTRYVLEAAAGGGKRVHCIFRAHQHAGVLNPMMRRLVASRGVFRHWQSGDSSSRLEAQVPELGKTLERDASRTIPQGSVWTFNVSPDSVYGDGCGFDFDTFGILTTAASAAEWRLSVITLPPNS
jgi:hypothetical protein